MKRNTFQLGDSQLKASNAFVADFHGFLTKQVIEDLIDTMRANELIGIAAPQIGENVQIFITEPRETKTRSKEQADELRVYVNPKIVSFSKEEVMLYEGCGSVCHGDLFGPVKRAKEISIEAFDINGKKFQCIADGILGRVIQHEYDHLYGIEFTEKISDYKVLVSSENYIKNMKGSAEQKTASIITKKIFKYIT